MNWDWDKLQEKRQRQGKAPTPQNDDSEGGFGDVNFSKFTPRFESGFPAGLALAGLALLWLASGIFIVNPGEEAIVTRFGKFARQVADGPHYRLPYPIEASIVENTKQLRSVEIGQASDNNAGAQSRSDESSMFTGDENIVHMHFKVQYSIDKLYNYLFKVRSPGQVVAIAAEAAMREVVGSRHIDNILTVDRVVIQVQAQEVLQTILNKYDSGIRVHEVQLLDVQPPAEVAEAFKDVASARENKVRIKNLAEAYRNEIEPLAAGTAKSVINAAEGYRQQVVLAAQGEASRFLAMAAEYTKAKDSTRKRLYYETMANMLAAPGMDKIIISKDAKAGTLPLIRLDGALPTSPPSASPASSGTSGMNPSGSVPQGAGLGISSSSSSLFPGAGTTLTPSAGSK